MSETLDRIKKFVEYSRLLSGYEKGEAQVFCDRLFQGFGHEGYKEAGASLEFKLKGKKKGFADLLWRPQILIEMKSRGEKLQKHYQQAFDYWLDAVPDRPKYVVLCNFDEFWIYNFNFQLHEPVDKVNLEDLPERYTALNFLFPDKRDPLFKNDLVAVTRDAADKVAQVFNSLVKRGEDRDVAQQFILQSVVSMFSEDFDLLPKDLFTQLLNDCINKGHSSHDLIGGLFRQMNETKPSRGGRFQKVPYFNGGLFENITPIDLTKDEATLLLEAAKQNWAKVAPPIFGTLFQSSMGKTKRHAYGAHFTNEADIQKIIRPTIVRPWREKIQKAKSLKDLKKLRGQLLELSILDPACGSGNFLYLAYREMVNLEMEILAKIHDNFGFDAQKLAGATSLIRTTQFFGIDKDPFAVELAKVTLMLAKRIALAEIQEAWVDPKQKTLPLNFEKVLPLDNLNKNIICEDALFCEWPAATYIIGNPPFQSKTKMVKEFGRDYVDKIRARYPNISGRADYCVYWIRRTHDALNKDGRAGLVGTNTISQNYSRESGLDYVTQNGGIIHNAVASQVWSGDAVVHVSIVNWTKGTYFGEKTLSKQLGDSPNSPWERKKVDFINASLSFDFDVTSAVRLNCNRTPKYCFQGQTHGHKGFLLNSEQLTDLITDNSSVNVVFPYLTGDELIGNQNGTPERFIIDLNHCEDITTAMKHKAAFERIKQLVMPDIIQKAEIEREKTGKKSGPRQSQAKHWWKLWRGRRELIEKLTKINRYIACSRITRRQIFQFVSTDIRPNDKLQVFALEDDYSFGIIASSFHWAWFVAKCTTLKRDFNYNAESIWETFPWPQSPTITQVKEVAKAGQELRQIRQSIMSSNSLTLRDLYRTMEIPGTNPIQKAQDILDKSVSKAYRVKDQTDPLECLLKLNTYIVKQENLMQHVTGPGLPPCVTNQHEFLSNDCVSHPNK